MLPYAPPFLLGRLASACLNRAVQSQSACTFLFSWLAIVCGWLGSKEPSGCSLAAQMLRTSRRRQRRVLCGTGAQPEAVRSLCFLRAISFPRSSLLRLVSLLLKLFLVRFFFLFGPSRKSRVRLVRAFLFFLAFVTPGGCSSWPNH